MPENPVEWASLNKIAFGDAIDEGAAFQRGILGYGIGLESHFLIEDEAAAVVGSNGRADRGYAGIFRLCSGLGEQGPADTGRFGYNVRKCGDIRPVVWQFGVTGDGLKAQYSAGFVCRYVTAYLVLSDVGELLGCQGSLEGGGATDMD